MRAIILLLLFTIPVLAAVKQRVLFRWALNPNGPGYIIQPVLGMKLRVAYVSGPQKAQPDFARCEVYNPKPNDPQQGARFDCDGTVYRVTGLIFTPEREQ